MLEVYSQCLSGYIESEKPLIPRGPDPEEVTLEMNLKRIGILKG